MPTKTPRTGRPPEGSPDLGKTYRYNARTTPIAFARWERLAADANRSVANMIESVMNDACRAKGIK